MDKSISLEIIKTFQKESNSESNLKLSRNAATHNEITDLAMDWDVYRRIDHTFSDQIIGEMKITNQKSSGRCWGYAGLNLFRIYLGRKHDIRNFEFSQTYFMFWDKLEKSNYFFNSIIKTANKPWDSRLMMHLLDSPIQDGGQWDMWVNLINKYGVVPKSEMPETFQSGKSMRMNRMITRKLREFAKDLRDSIKNKITEESLFELKTTMLSTVYKMLVIHLGNPPDSFNWQVRDNKKVFQRFKNLTPLSFFKDHVGIDLNELVCLINCPMSDKEYNKVYTVEFLGNVVEGNPIRYLNVDIDVLKNATVESIKNNEPVWFGCDVGKYLHRTHGVMDTKLFDFELFYGTEFGLDKASRLEYGESKMTHAMLFTGVDLDSKGNPKKWRVENSWGERNGKKGYYIMSDDWFDQYLYEVVINKKYLELNIIDLYENQHAKLLPPWDPMGALAK
jgi:bleomycin hydrolase|tara:strand:- start:20727 stop:22070 length:1344 start_codon:yes stop_codon:yes gene_type:complete